MATLSYTLPTGESVSFESNVAYQFARWIDTGDGQFYTTWHRTERAAQKASLPSPLYKGRPQGIVPII